MFPKAGSDILKASICAAAVHSLVSTWGIESTQMAKVGSHFDIVEMLLINERRYCRAPSVPTNLQTVVTFLDIFRKQVDCRWVRHRPPIKPTQVMVSFAPWISADSVSAVNSSPLFAHKNWLWQPGQRHGHPEILMASVTSSGNSWKTISVLI